LYRYNETPSPAGGERISIYTPRDQQFVDDKDHTLCDLFETGRKITGDWNFLGTTTGEVRVNGVGGRARGRDRENKEEVGSTK